MNKLRVWMLGILAMAGIMAASGQGVIMTNDFESGAVSLNWVRVQESDIDTGWYADSQAPSAWEISGGLLQNNVTNQTAIGEGAAVQVVSYGVDTNTVVDISFDYNVAAGDTLYVHVWGLDSPAALDGDWFANFQASGGSLSDNTSRNDGLTAFNIKDGGGCGSPAQALVALAGPLSGTYTNSINIESLNVPGVENAGEFEYYLVGFARNEDGLPGTNSVDNLLITTSYDAPPVIPDSGIVGSPIYPNQNVVVSQPDNTHAAPFNWTAGVSGNTLGQSFSLGSAQDVAAITFQKVGDLSLALAGTHEIELWIGEYDSSDATNHVTGATLHTQTFNVAGNTFLDQAWYSMNLSSNIAFDAGTEYAFELAWTTADASHAFSVNRYYEGAGGTDTYPDGTIIYQAGVSNNLPVPSLINQPENDMTFVLHSAGVTEPGYFAVDPDSLGIIVIESEATAVDAVSVTYNSSTNMELSITISAESHPGSFSVVGGANQTLTEPWPDSSDLEFQFDRSVSNLIGGDQATAVAIIDWNEAGGGDSGQFMLALTGTVTFAADQENTWIGSGDGVSWDDVDNWNLARVPGALAADIGIISGALTVDVSSDFTGLFSWGTTVDNGATLNISADFIGGAALTMTGATWNQTAGDAEATTLTMDGTSAINLTGGTLAVSAASSIPTGAIVDINGGGLILDNTAAAFILQNNGLIKLQSGSLTSPSGNAAMQIHQDVEISGGTLVLSSQTYFGGIVTINGDAAGDLNVTALNNHGGINGEFHFNLGELGVSKFHSSAWMNLNYATIVVDGSNYVGGTRSIPLFTSGNLASTSTAFSVVNFDPAAIVEITQVMGNGGMYLNITVPGYEGWAGSHDLVGADADGDVDYDLDGDVNFYEYAFGGDPTNIAVKGHAQTGQVVEDGVYYEYVYARRVGPDTGLDYEAQFGTDLVFTDWSGTEVVELPITGTIDADYESVTNRVDMTGKPVGFMQVTVEEL